MEKTTFEGQPLAVFHAKQIAVEARQVQNETVRDRKRQVRGGIKEKYPIGKGERSMVRYYSDEEVEVMNQKVLAQAVDVTGIPGNGKTHNRIVALLYYVAKCVLEDGYFNVSKHATGQPDVIMDAMKGTINLDNKMPYYKQPIHTDIRRLIKYNKIYSKGKKTYRHFFLVSPIEQPKQPEEKLPVETTGLEEKLKEAITDALPSIVQKILFDVAVDVRVKVRFE